MLDESMHRNCFHRLTANLAGEKSKNCQKKRKFKIPKKIDMQKSKRKMCITFHDPRAIGCRDMTAKKFDG